MQGDIVVAVMDTWTSRKMRDAGEAPDRPRGSQIRVVHRRVAEADEEVADYFVGGYESDDMFIVLIHPWSAVMALSDWDALPDEQRVAEKRTAISHFQIFGNFASLYGPCFFVEIDAPGRPERETPAPSDAQTLRALPFFKGIPSTSGSASSAHRR